MKLLLCLACVLMVWAEDKPSAVPKVMPASNEAEQAISGMQVPKGYKLDLVAAEPHLANPVAFCIDHRGRFYVSESFRLHEGVTDIRGHMDWLLDDLAAESVEDRVKFLRKNLGASISDYEIASDRVRRLVDTNGDGKIDHSSVVADGFKNIADGLASGVLARGKDVYFTNIPHLWKLTDNDDDGVADERESLAEGFGVHIAFLGHDLHGLTVGPDGRLYFSIGDRGLRVRTKEGKMLINPHSGAVLRCELDGSKLELFATGQRNPQELAFDEFGNLFTGDNNCDSGDRARLVYIVDQIDTGWRIAYQTAEFPVPRGPWNSESIWEVGTKNHPAYCIPPIAYLGDGPSGLTYHPGAGFSDQFKRNFFVCDFRGTPSRSGIRTFTVTQKGASFEMSEAKQFLWSVLATDCDFGYDGNLYVSDWVEGWAQTGKGRIYRLSYSGAKQGEQNTIKELFAQGFEKLATDKLVSLLVHPDKRVRQEAQLTLATRGEAEQTFLNVMKSPATNASADLQRLARIHAIWGLGQLARNGKAKTLAETKFLATDPDAEIRAQYAQFLGEANVPGSSQLLASLLVDSNLRVRMHAGLAVARAGLPVDLNAITKLLSDNNDQDHYVRHAGMMALTVQPAESFKQASEHASPSVRLAAAVAARRTANLALVTLLRDTDQRVVAEAARAINDLPLEQFAVNLARLPITKDLDPVIWRRIVNANFRLGGQESAARLASYINQVDLPRDLRVMCLQALEQWQKPSVRDWVTGEYRPLTRSTNESIESAITPHLAAWLNDPQPEVQLAAIEVAVANKVKSTLPALVQLLKGVNADRAKLRASLLRALVALEYTDAKPLLQSLLTDKQELVRIEARKLFAMLDESAGLKQSLANLQTGTIPERQSAMLSIGKLKSEEAAAQVRELWSDLQAGKIAPEIQVEVLEAFAEQGKRDKKMAAEYDAHVKRVKASTEPVKVNMMSLVGGNAEAGKKVFVERNELACVRCHKIGDKGGEVGPVLTEIGKQKTREYLLESIVHPNKEIAKGFDTVVIELDDGSLVTGIVKSETPTELTLINADAKTFTVKKDAIVGRKNGKSAMPEDLRNKMSPRDLRDLVEYLTTLGKPASTQDVEHGAKQ